MPMKAQVSTEYLVIMAVVLVIALVVVYLVGGFSSLGNSALASKGQQYWASASPIAITNYKLTSNVTGNSFILTVANQGLNILSITNVSASGTAPSGSAFSLIPVPTFVQALAPGQSATIMLPLTSPGAVGNVCPSTGQFDFVISFLYNQQSMNGGGINGITETSTTPLVVSCS
jgi:hypothetical protein